MVDTYPMKQPISMLPRHLVGMVVHRSDGSIQSFNEAAQEILGQALFQTQRDSATIPWQTIHPDGTPFPADTHPAIETLRTGKACHQVVMGFYRVEGELVWIVIDTQPLFSVGEASPTSVVVTFSKISGPTVAGPTVDTSDSASPAAMPLVSALVGTMPAEAMLQTLLANAPNIIFFKDTAGRYVTLNKVAAGFLGLTVAEVVGKTDEDLFNPEVSSAIKQADLQVMETGQATAFEEKIVYEGVLRTLMTTKAPWRDSVGHLLGVMGICQDVTALRQSNAILKESETRFRLMTELLPQIFWTAAVTGKLDYYSTQLQDYVGEKIEPETGWEWQAVIHPEDREKTTELWLEAVEQGTFYQCEHRLRRADGEYFWHLSRAMPCRTESGEITKWYGTTIGIHEQKQTLSERDQALEREQLARAEAERANRIKDEFLAVLSHELRSPLSPILGWARLMQERQLSEERTAKALESIERNAKLQTQLIDDLLDIAKILRGKLKFAPQPVTIDTVVASAVETVRTTAVAKSIELTLRVEHAAVVLGDATRLQQIVLNLLTNAIKFTPASGQVEVRLYRADTQIAIAVRDTGKGIKAEFLPHLFESFRQEDATVTRSYGGLGLGLSIVHHLVKLHGGTVSAQSPGEGLGSTFTVSLPMAAAAAETEQTPGESSSEPDLAGLCILAVDDDEDSREIVAEALSAYSATVRSVACATEAIALLATYQPDVLVLDIGMPGVDGYTLLKQIRSLPTQQHDSILAIALTAYARDEDRTKALTAGFQAHLTKPVDILELAKAVETLAKSL